MQSIEPSRVQRALEGDGAFRRAARGWTGSFAFADDRSHLLVALEAGEVASVGTGNGAVAADVVFIGPAAGWDQVFAAVPPPFYQDLLGGAVGHHGFSASGDTTTMAAYYAAIQRAVVLAGRAIRGEVS